MATEGPPSPCVPWRLRRALSTALAEAASWSEPCSSAWRACTKLIAAAAWEAGASPAAWAAPATMPSAASRSEEHTSELQSQSNLVCRLLLEKKKKDRPPDA